MLLRAGFLDGERSGAESALGVAKETLKTYPA